MPRAKNGQRGNVLLKAAPPRLEKELRDLVNQDRGVDRQHDPMARSGKRISRESIVVHALATFGSIEKAQHWMNRPNPLFCGKTPSQVMRTDPVNVEAELVRIDHGVYV